MDQIRPERRIDGSAAVLLPFDASGRVAWEDLRAHIARTHAAGLTPAVNMDTGNDLAIDMVMYGSDYLLGLATFAPDLFARPDEMWERGDPDFYELNDPLQYLGFFAFRLPVPGYRHSAAQFLKLRGWIECDDPHPDAERRPDSDIAVIASVGRELGAIS